MVPHTAQDDAQGAQICGFCRKSDEQRKTFYSDNASIILIIARAGRDRLSEWSLMN